MRSRYYVQVVGSYDDKFVGPFHDPSNAAAHAELQERSGFVARVLTADQYADNLRAFGPANLEEPVSP